MDSNLVAVVTSAPALVTPNTSRMKGNPFFAYLATQGSDYSVINIRSRLNGFAKFMGGSHAETFDWSQLTYMSILAYRKYLQNRSQMDPSKKDLKTGSINTIVVALKGIAEVCETMNIISTDQAKAIRKIKQLRYYRIPSGRALSCDESQKLLMQKFFCDYHAGFPAECNSKTKDLRTGITFQSLGISFFFNLFNCFVCFCK